MPYRVKGRGFDSFQQFAAIRSHGRQDVPPVRQGLLAPRRDAGPPQGGAPRREAVPVPAVPEGLRLQFDEHARIAHQDVRPHACTECDRRFHKAADLKKHQAIHARKGFVYRSSREEHVARLLEEEGLAFEREVRVDFEGGGLARLDFLLRMDWGLCALEVDEGAHCLREQAEEAERMLKVRARHPKLRFVRYNPDCFGVGGQLAEVPQSERHARLLRAVREPPRQDFEVVYLCYDQAQPDSPLPQLRRPRLSGGAQALR